MKVYPTANFAKQDNQLGLPAKTTHLDQRISFSNRFIGCVKSVMTRHMAETKVHFVLMELGDGSQFCGKWQELPEELPPNLGEIILVDIDENGLTVQTEKTVSADAASQRPCNPCLFITHWQRIRVPYPVDILDQIYRVTEPVSALDRLWGIIERISVPCLRAWLSNVLADTQLSLPFFQVPASNDHHHSSAGGLLLHSIECAEWVERITIATLNPKEAALAIVAALLHDFGKVVTMRSPEVSQMVAHEVLTLTLLEPALVELQLEWSQGAYALRQMLSWQTQPGKFPQLPGTLLVKMADQYSAALSAREKAFLGLPAYYFWAKLRTPYSIQSFNRIN